MVKIRVLGRRSRLNPVLERLYGVQQVQLVGVREEPELDLQPPGNDSALVQRQAELQSVAARLEATLELLGTGRVTAVTDLTGYITEGQVAMSDADRRYLAFAADFERRYVDQAGVSRSIEQTLDLAWELLARFPASELKRVKPEHLERYYHPADEAPS